MVAVCHWSRLMNIFFTDRRDGAHSLNAFLSCWVAPYGWPQALRMDGEGGFDLIISQAPHEGCSTEITACNSSHTNGVTERHIRHLRQMTSSALRHSEWDIETCNQVWSMAVSHCVRAHATTPNKHCGWLTPAQKAGQDILPPPYFFSQPICYAEPDQGTDESGLIGKFLPRNQLGHFLCLEHPGACFILNKDKKPVRLHPRLVQAVTADTGGPSFVSPLPGSQPPMPTSVRKSSGGEGTPVDTVADIIGREESDMAGTICGNPGSQRSLSPEELERAIEHKQNLSKKNTCVHEKHQKDPWKEKKPGYCRYGMCRYHCVLTHHEELHSNADREVCKQHGYSPKAAEHYTATLRAMRTPSPTSPPQDPPPKPRKSTVVDTPTTTRMTRSKHKASLTQCLVESRRDPEMTAQLQCVRTKCSLYKIKAQPRPMGSTPWNVPMHKVKFACPEELEGMKAELAGWKEKEVYEVLSEEEGQRLLKERKAVLLTATWVLKKKEGAVKGRLVLRGFLEPVVEPNYSPTVSVESVRAMIAAAAQKSLTLGEADVSQAFLHAKAEGLTILIRIPHPKTQEENGGFWKLLKNAYGRRNAPRAWYCCFRDEAAKEGWHPLPQDPCIFIKKDEKDPTKVMDMLVLHVDDALAAGQSAVKSLQNLEFKYGKGPRELPEGKATFAGIEISSTEEGILIHQQAYTQSLAESSEAPKRKIHSPMPTDWKVDEESPKLNEKDHEKYRQYVGKLLWLCNCTRPDLALAVSVLSRYCQSPTAQTMKLAENVMGYVLTNSDYGIMYPRERSFHLEVYSDATWAGLRMDHSCQSQSGYVVALRYDENTLVPLAWKSHRQKKVTRSSYAAELLAFDAAMGLTIHLSDMLQEMGCEMTEGITIMTDSQSLLDSCHSLQPGRDKSTYVAVAALRETLVDYAVKSGFVPGQNNVADDMTKPTTMSKIKELMVPVGTGRMANVMLIKRAEHTGQPNESGGELEKR